MKAVFLKGSFLILAASLVGTLALGDEAASTTTTAKRPMVMLDGYVGTFSKFGFNQTPVDATKDRYPTESFTSLVTQLDLNIDPSQKFGWEDTSLTFDVGATLGGLAYDSTKFDNNGTNGGGLAFNYFGYRDGYFRNAQEATGNNTRNIIVHNAYVDFKSKYFDFKGGRYESDADYLSGYNQGFSTNVHYKFGDNNEAKLWWMSSWGRGLAYSRWFYDFYSESGGWQKDNFSGLHFAGLDLTFGNADNTRNILVRPFVEFANNIFTQVGGKVVATFGDSNFKSKTHLQGYWVGLSNATMNDPSKLSAVGTGLNAKLFGETLDKNSFNLALIQTFYVKDFDFGLGLYKNFGFANAIIGTTGNASFNSYVDVNANSVYAYGRDYINALARNAFSAYGFVGGTHDVGIGDLTWNLQYRYTTAPRAEENSLSLDIYQQFKDFGVGLNLVYLGVQTNAGYAVGQLFAGNPSTLGRRYDDRSHAYFYIDYKFSSGVKNFMKKSYTKL
ncbi:outer membrane family protein [Helicobacter sp. 11S02629-2]|uniref:outer membrane family protein n=1 Tax=Helicobacter sp. 11S02629-2 TaxID=1476195 RepID=UPI000BA756B4|nr:outer membrane family protein [Helicobacter sp. 11S02629-2]PAF45857.1 hypothetical protein BKH40_00115 [Helicobacter sp. 11S02629-2]